MKKLLMLLLVLVMAVAAQAQLILHYDFEEESGDVAYDQVGSRDGVLENGVGRSSTTVGNIGGTVTLDAMYHNVYVGAWTDAPMNGGDFTMSIAFKLDDPYGGDQALMGWDGMCVGVANGGVWSLWSTPTTTYGVWHGGNPAGVWDDTGWHYLTISYKQDAAPGQDRRSLYLDGVLAGTDNLVAGDAGQGYWEMITRLGLRQDIQFQAYGEAGDFKVWDTALTATEVYGEYEAVMIPEPMTIILLGTGLVLAQRRRLSK